MTENSLPVNQDRLLNTFFALIAFNTPSRSEEAASKWAASYLQNIGFTCRWDDAGEKVNGSVGNLFAFKKGTVADAPSIFFSSHLDTVEPTPNLTWEVDGDTIRSTSDTILGADDKCGVAPILEAMTLLHESGEAHGDIQIILTICEEIGLVGAKLIDTADIHAQYGFVLDSGPPIGSLLHSAPSQNSLLVTIEGVPSHAGSSPEKGISAIVAASKAISKMTLGRIDSETTANIGTITGGSGRNVVPAKVVIHAEARSMNAEKLAEQTRHMVTIFEQEAAAMGAKATVEVTEQYHTYRLNDDDAVIRLARQAGEMCGFTVATRPTGGGSDANFFNRKGVPTTVLATGMQKVHTHDEFCSIQAMVQDAEWVVAIVRTARDWRE